LDRIEIRPGPRELPKDSLEKFRQKEPSTEIYPKEPNRSDKHPGKTQGFRSSPYQDLATQQRIATENAKTANEQLARRHQEREAAKKALDQHITRSAGTQAERANPSARDFLRQDLARSDNPASNEFRLPSRESLKWNLQGGPPGGPPDGRNGPRQRDDDGPGKGPDRPSPGGATARNPEGPDRPPPGAATARNPETSRDALNQHIARTENSNRTQTREASREKLQRHIENPDRGQAREQNQSINRPRGIER
jgi:hypothetical protein